ncbi:S1 RNA-binding domain-containing protein [Aerococcaceae bacterium DSM 109653]|uniref:S1 RNA-binding domain-containing protein n=2 Tax=Fundicoccus ignavus TaxID=2664442 RepID=A0A6I2GY26_9LACT|nr:S1 RNA-binding domain-containing protein [Fundicoccus ignavus]MRI85293.1 S1 RNA-binding domain-containing protein [Fundicoccus ignavus]MRJ48176.1 S1 RNA-binding domain-containing protein [Fundicoccus ignavus]
MMTTNFKIGDIIEGEVTGIQNYGVFISLSDTEQGLIHISECRHGYMTEIDDFVKIGQKLKVMIIDIDEFTNKISLSMRVLQKLNTPPFPARSKRRRKRYTPNIGFSSLAKKLPHWIDEALKEIEQDDFTDKVRV